MLFIYITSFNLQNNLHSSYLFGFIFKAEKIKAHLLTFAIQPIFDVLIVWPTSNDKPNLKGDASFVFYLF